MKQAFSAREVVRLTNIDVLFMITCTPLCIVLFAHIAGLSLGISSNHMMYVMI